MLILPRGQSSVVPFLNNIPNNGRLVRSSQREIEMISRKPPDLAS